MRVVIGKGGPRGRDEPNVHAMWAPAEVAHLMTNRPTFLADKDHPAADICGAMSAAMAASSMAIREHGHALKGPQGVRAFDPVAFADRCWPRRRNLLVFAHANPARAHEGDGRKQGQEVHRRQRLALRSDGQVVEIGYRASVPDKIFTAATWLAPAPTAKGPRAAADDGGSSWPTRSTKGTTSSSTTTTGTATSAPATSPSWPPTT
jgi:hypothetical protein